MQYETFLDCIFISIIIGRLAPAGCRSRISWSRGELTGTTPCSRVPWNYAYRAGQFNSLRSLQPAYPLLLLLLLSLLSLIITEQYRSKSCIVRVSSFIEIYLLGCYKYCVILIISDYKSLFGFR